MHLVGRAAELSVVRACIGATRARVLVVRGEAGIGKTQLLAALMEACEEARYDVRLGHATEHEKDSPLALFRDVLDLDALGADEDRWQRVQALRDVLESARPAALVLDDAHWADPASLELLELLLRRPPRSRHVVALGVRPGTVADRLIAAARASGTVIDVLDLTGLDRSSADELLADRSVADREHLFAISGGNPLFLHELGRAAVGDVPDGILAAVTAELAPLGKAAVSLVRAGSLLGDPFDFDLAREAVGLALDPALAALDELTHHRVLTGGANLKEYRFRHPVVRTAIYESQTPAERLSGHARAAAVLEAAGRPLIDQARHLAQTATVGDATAAAALRMAASRIRGQAPTIAADWLLAAQRAAPAEDVEPFSDLAEVLIQSGRLEEALAVAEDGIAAAGGTANDLARLALVAGSVERQLGRHDASRRRLERALAGDALTDELTMALAISAYELGDYAEVYRRASAARNASAPLVRACAAALIAMWLRFSGAVQQSQAEADVAVATVKDATDSELAANAEMMMVLAWALVAIERWDDALAIGGRAATAAHRAGNLAGEVPLLLAEVQALGLLGRTTEAASVADRAEVTARLTHTDQPLQWALWMRAWVLLEVDELDHALQCAEESVALVAELDESALGVVARAVLGSVLLALGRAEEALPLLAAYDVDPGWISRWAPRVAEAQLLTGDLAGARQTAARATELAEVLGLAGPSAAAAITRALAADQTDVLEHAQQAIEHATSIGACLDLARGHLLAGRALGETDRPGAIEHLEAARGIAQAGGAARLESEAGLELRRLGRRVGRGGPRTGTDTGLASLSSREREIADLVARGLTNRQIAERLFLSEKTIEAHLSRTFSKLGVSGRAAVAAAVASGTGPS